MHTAAGVGTALHPTATLLTPLGLNLPLLTRTGNMHTAAGTGTALTSPVPCTLVC